MEPPSAIWIGQKQPHTVRGILLTLPQFLRRLPKRLPVPATVWATGGMVLRGRTYNDIDIILKERSLTIPVALEMERIFGGMKVEIGYANLVGYTGIGRYPAICIYVEGERVD